MSGVEVPASPGSMVRSAEESGTIRAEYAGEVFDHLVRRGPWDLFDQDEEITITVKPTAEKQR